MTAAKRQPSAPRIPFVPEAPAKVMGDHVQDRVLSLSAGAGKGWTRLTVFERAHRKGQLVCRENCTDPKRTEEEVNRAVDRYESGKTFAEMWLLCEASFPSASDYNRVRVAGTPGSFADVQIDTKDFMRRLEACLGTRDWMILRRVCGENHQIAETIHDISPSYRYSTLTRFREALDALVEAIPKAQKARKK